MLMQCLGHKGPVVNVGEELSKAYYPLLAHIMTTTHRNFATPGKLEGREIRKKTL
jgi:hypothetical protein